MNSEKSKENTNSEVKQFLKKKQKLNVPIFGMANVGNTCYFNSLLQCIFSCSYLMAYLVDELEPKNQVQHFFQTSFLELIEIYNKEERELFDQHAIGFSAKLLSLLLQNKQHLNIHDQQSCSEFFLILIEELGIDFFFKTKHDISIECSKCGNVNKKVDENYHFEMFCDSMQEQNNQNIYVSINQYIINKYDVDDYRCEKCNQRCKASCTSKASTISQYFVILLNKYFYKNLVVFPSSFELPILSNNENRKEKEKDKDSLVYVWKNIAQVEHSGNLMSGHYTAMCNRLNQVVIFDDVNTSLASIDNLVPTRSTYMVFYEQQ